MSETLSDPRFCQRCGERTNKDDIFCKSCGNQIAETVQALPTVKKTTTSAGQEIGPAPKKRSESEQRTWWYLFSFVVTTLAAFIEALIANDPLGGLIFVLILVPIGLVTWYFIARKISGGTLSLVKLYTRRHKKSSNSFYFFVEESTHRDILSKTIRVILASLGLSSFFLDLFVAVAPSASETDRFGVFVVIFWITVFVMPLVFYPIWIYDDAGLRHYEADRKTVSIPGDELRELVSVVGALLAVVSMVSVFSVGFLTSLLVRAFIIFLPVCLTGTVLFTFVLEPRLVARFRRDSIAKGLVVHGGNIEFLERPLPPTHEEIQERRDHGTNSSGHLGNDEIKDEQMHCPTCGAGASKNDNYCQRCGQKLMVPGS